MLALLGVAGILAGGYAAAEAPSEPAPSSVRTTPEGEGVDAWVREGAVDPADPRPSPAAAVAEGGTGHAPGPRDESAEEPSEQVRASASGDTVAQLRERAAEVAREARKAEAARRAGHVSAGSTATTAPSR